MSISFNSIKGFHNKVNLGDNISSIQNANKSHQTTNGNPSNWLNNNNITKDPSKGIHTRYIEKVNSDIINSMHRNEEHFQDRMYEHISVYPKGQNIMVQGVNYGTNPYKIGDSSKSCDFNIGDYVKAPYAEYPLSRIPAKQVNGFTNLYRPEQYVTKPEIIIQHHM